ncbi:hypothetical protein [Isoptericola sp. BMS4]|uniref:hypothetical protein n=1 Tax=Isoptericola sp. BMS4 TaxID=2527875 RepID=UPI001420D8C9|nr:hypothetical protein [Isoptericola sp. BMS4]
MNEITENGYRSIANPRRTTLASRTPADAATPRRGSAEGDGLQMLADDAALCADGSCALPE